MSVNDASLGYGFQGGRVRVARNPHGIRPRPVASRCSLGSMCARYAHGAA